MDETLWTDLQTIFRMFPHHYNVLWTEYSCSGCDCSRLGTSTYVCSHLCSFLKPFSSSGVILWDHINLSPCFCFKGLGSTDFFFSCTSRPTPPFFVFFCDLRQSDIFKFHPFCHNDVFSVRWALEGFFPPLLVLLW